MLKGIIDKQEHIPDYAFDLEKDIVHIYPKSEFQKKFNSPAPPNAVDKILLKSGTFEKAKRFAKKFDVYFIESEWRAMLFDKDEIPDNPDGSFINYVKWYAKNH